MSTITGRLLLRRMRKDKKANDGTESKLNLPKGAEMPPTPQASLWQALFPLKPKGLHKGMTGVTPGGRGWSRHVTRGYSKSRLQ